MQDENLARLQQERRDLEAITSWREWQARAPDECRVNLIAAKAARIMATTHPSTPQHAEALAQYEQALRDRVAYWQANSKAHRNAAIRA